MAKAKLTAISIQIVSSEPGFRVRSQYRLWDKPVRKRRQRPEGKVQIIAVTDQLKPEFGPKRPERLRRVDRHMAVPRCHIPPVQSVLQEICWLQQG